MKKNYISPKLEILVINISSFCLVTSDPTETPSPGENEEIYKEIW